MLSNLFAQAQDSASPMNISYGIVILVLLALVLGVSTISARRKQPWSASLSQGLGSLLWASPVIAISAVVGMKVVPYFQFGAAGHLKPEPSHLQTEVDEKQVEFVESFPERTVPVSIDPESASEEETLPEWTSKRMLVLASRNGKADQEVRRVVASGGWEKSIEAARENVLAEAAKIVQEDFQRFYPGGSALPKVAIGKHALKAEAIEVQSHDVVDTPFKMYKVYAQVELSPKVRQELSGTWKTEVAMRRSELLAGVLGLLTLIAGSFAAYFHLDKKSNGNYRFRLKLAATALMTAGGLGLLAALSNAA